MRNDSTFRCFPLRILHCVFILASYFPITGNVSALVIGADSNPLHPPKIESSALQGRYDEKGPSTIEKRSILLKIGYDGSHFSGWSAANKSQRSVEGELQKRLAKILGNLSHECVIVEGCSRTDRGVHAEGMVAQAYAITPAAMEAARMGSCPFPNQPSVPGKRYPHPWNTTDSTECFVPIMASTTKIGFALNRMSGDDLRIFAVAPSPIQIGDVPFHPTIDARWKTYQYTIATGSLADPIRRKRVWHLGKIDDERFVERMQDAARLLQGVHDFTAFSCTPKGSQDRKRRKGTDHDGVCHLDSIQCIQTDYTWRDNQEYTITITGNRFLYKMVRMLVGTLVAAGMEEITESQLETALISGERLPNNSIECAPAHGLVLERVDFDAAIAWEPVNS